MEIIFSVGIYINSFLGLSVAEGMPQKKNTKEKRAGGREEYIISNFSLIWADTLGLSGRAKALFRLECSPEVANYITRPIDSIEAALAIGEALEGGKCSVILDAFACVGGNAIGFVSYFKNSAVFAVQRVASQEENDRFARLNHNLSMVTRLVERTKPCTAVPMDVRSFIQDINPETIPEVSVLNLDPPWALGPNLDQISPLWMIRRFLIDNVFTPCRAKQINPRIICLKVPERIADVESWPALPVEYTLHTYVFVRSKYHLYILTSAA